MTPDDLFELLKLLVTGKTDLGTVLGAPIALLVAFIFALLAAVPALIKIGRPNLAAMTFFLASGLAGTFYVMTGGKVATAGATSQPFELYAGRVLIGGNLASSAAQAGPSTLEDCQKLCLANSRCVAFTFDNVQQSCFQKATLSDLHAFASAVTGIKRASDVSSSR